MMSSPEYNYDYINESSKLLELLFDEYGFKFHDLSNIELFDDSFYLDGFHSNRNIYFHILNYLGIPLNSDFKNEFEISKEEMSNMKKYFSIRKAK